MASNSLAPPVNSLAMLPGTGKDAGDNKIHHNNEEGSAHIEDQVVEIRKTRGCVLLDPEDLVFDVLDDNDFVSVRMEYDLPDAAVIHSLYV